MVGARSLAMALNRLIDAGIDAREPAHRGPRAPVRGADASARVLVVLPAPRSLVFLVAVWQLDPVVRWLWPIPVAGVRDLPVPEALHVALPPLARRRRRPRAGRRAGSRSPASCRGRRGRSAAPSRPGSPGFDLFYSLFDVEIDREQGLHSWADALRRARRVPRRRLMHLATVALLVAVGLGLPSTPGTGPA